MSRSIISSSSTADVTADDQRALAYKHHATETDSEDDYPIFRRRSPSPSKASKSKQQKPVKQMNTMPPSSQSRFQTFKMSSNAIGQVAPREQRFSPLFAVMKYPYRYLKGETSERVSRAYFAEGKFHARGWTLFYVHTLLQPAKPLLLVPASEVEALFTEINAKLILEMGFPDAETDPSFLLSFLQVGTPRPRFLGRLTSKEALSDLESKIPEPGRNQYGEEAMDPEIIGPWKAMMEAAVRAGKSSSKQSKEKRKKDRLLKKVAMRNQLERTGCYLGIRPRSNALADPLAIPNLNWNEYQAAAEEHEKQSAILQNIDITKPTPNDFYLDVIFISIDVESYERIPNLITEIGISTLDTRDLHSLAPGEDGKAWMKKIRSRHFRIIEAAHLENSDYVTGCADRFEKGFGTSEWISIKDAPQVVDSCFRYPYSAPAGSRASTEVTTEGESDQTAAQSPSSSNPEIEGADRAERKIILVGHDTKADVEYLYSMGYDVSQLDNILEPLDTADMFRVLMHEHQPRSLGSVLLGLDLSGWNLHNAGNDAAYTLQALVGICFRRQDPDSHAKIMRERDANLKGASEEIKQQILQDAGEWELAYTEEGDGGEPVRMRRRKTASQISTNRSPEEKKGSNKLVNSEDVAEVVEGEESDAPENEEVISEGRGEHLDTRNREGGPPDFNDEIMDPQHVRHLTAAPATLLEHNEAPEKSAPSGDDDFTISAPKLARLARLDKMTWSF